MINCIITIIGLCLFLNWQYEKHAIYYRLEQRSKTVKFKFLHTLMNCRGCIMFHTGAILFVMYAVFIDFDIRYLAVPFIVSGFVVTFTAKR